jgi:hypothetical protein
MNMNKKLTRKDFFEMTEHKSMPFDFYIQFKHPEYIYLKIIPGPTILIRN